MHTLHEVLLDLTSPTTLKWSSRSLSSRMCCSVQPNSIDLLLKLLANDTFCLGILDVDYGPSIPRMMNVDGKIYCIQQCSSDVT